MSDPCDCFGCEEEGHSLPAYESTPELALAALLSLMTRFPARRSPAVARPGAPRQAGCAAPSAWHLRALLLCGSPPRRASYSNESRL